MLLRDGVEGCLVLVNVICGCIEDPIGTGELYAPPIMDDAIGRDGVCIALIGIIGNG